MAAIVCYTAGILSFLNNKTTVLRRQGKDMPKLEEFKALRDSVIYSYIRHVKECGGVLEKE